VKSIKEQQKLMAIWLLFIGKKRDLKRALEYQLKALKGAKAGGNKKQILKNLENLKRIYKGLKNWKKVREIEKEIRKLEGKRKRF
jgi:hypothetical protein